MIVSFRRVVLTGASLAICAGPALGAPDYRPVTLSDGVFLTPALDVEHRYDDNIFQTDSDEQDSSVTVVSPAAEVALESGNNAFTFGYGGAYGFFESSSQDNYDDHSLRAAYDRSGGRVGLEAYAAYFRGHDARGTGPSNGLGDLSTSIFDEPTIYDLYEWGAGLLLGAPQGRTRVRLGYDASEREYTNFRDITRARDRDSETFSGKVSFRVSGRTDLVAEASRQQFDYTFTEPGDLTLDSDEVRYLVGAEWQATGKTSGELKIGFQEKDFEDSARSDEDGLTWQVGVTWEPRTYSSFTLSTSKTFRETDNVGNVIATTGYGVSWNHSWMERVSTDVGISLNEEDYEGTNREDDFMSFTGSVNYDWRRWMTLNAGVRVSTRDSSLATAEFDRNVVFIGAQFGL